MLGSYASPEIGPVPVAPIRLETPVHGSRTLNDDWPFCESMEVP
jgi:hypothetical protein